MMIASRLVAHQSASASSHFAPPLMPTLAHLSGNWERVRRDVARRFDSHPVLKDEPLLDLADADQPVYSADLERAFAAMLQLGLRAREAGCTHAIIACNTMNLLRPRFEEATGLQVFDMITPAKAAAASVAKRVGLIATTATAQSSLYAHSEYQLVLPSDEEQAQIQQLIVAEKATLEPTVSPFLLQVLRSLVRRGAEALILGCTDFATLLPPQDAASSATAPPGYEAGLSEQVGGVPIIDPLAELLRAAAAHVLQERQR